MSGSFLFISDIDQLIALLHNANVSITEQGWVVFVLWTKELLADEEMNQLRAAVQRLIVDNEQKSMQINNLRTALDEQIKIKAY